MIQVGVIAADHRPGIHTVQIPWQHQGEYHLFHGAAGGRKGPAWLRFVAFARVGVELAVETQLIPLTPRRTRHGRWWWPISGSQAGLVKSIAWSGSDGPECSAFTTRRLGRVGSYLPGMSVAELSADVDVFLASAVASEQLASDMESIPPALPQPELTLSVSGNHVTVDGKTYCLDEGPAAFVKALVDAGSGFGWRVRRWELRFNPTRAGLPEDPQADSGQDRIQVWRGISNPIGVVTPRYPTFPRVTPNFGR